MTSAQHRRWLFYQCLVVSLSALAMVGTILLAILAAIQAVASGNAYFSPSITRILVEEYVTEMRRRGVEDSYDLLSLREKEIMQLLVSGKSNREISDMLHLSISTVETHRNNIFQKLGVHNLPELILYAVRKGLVS